MEEPKNINEELKKESPPTSGDQKDDSNDKNKDVYFVIITTSKKKIDFKGLKYETENNIKLSIIFNKTIDKEDKTYLEEIVFKLKKKTKKKEKNMDKKESTKSTKYTIKFIEEAHIYNITFSLKDDCFAYQPELKTGNKYLPKFLKNQSNKILFLYT